MSVTRGSRTIIAVITLLFIVVLLGFGAHPATQENIDRIKSQIGFDAPAPPPPSKYPDSPSPQHEQGHTQQQTAASSKQYCKWQFSHYESSEYEEEWFRLVPTAQKNICQVVAEPAHTQASKDIVSRVEELVQSGMTAKWPTVDSFPLGNADARDSYMSKMHYSRVCFDPSSQEFKPATGYGIQLIEPLWGMLRDPFDHWCGALALKMTSHIPQVGQSKEHIMPQGFAPYAYDVNAASADHLSQWRSHGTPPWQRTLRPENDPDYGVFFSKPRTIYLDLGAAYFKKWHGAADAASGEWFYDHYHARGLPFDHFLAVELEKLNHTEVFAQVPADLIGKYAMMNTALSMDKDKMNTVDLIRRIANPEDFLVFKLDIDSAPIEEPIANALLHDNPPGISALVDELMFEHHVKYEPMVGAWWLTDVPDNEVGTLADSYDLFRGLRRRGIRAHSWP